MLKVGLTGGIATGKSHVVALLRAMGCEVLDADVVAHQVIEP
jgi:dephospho-CoA kinase